MSYIKILKTIEKASEEELKKVETFLIRFKYPKLLFLALSIISSYYVFTNPLFTEQINHLQGYGYYSIFISGLLFSFGFTTPFAVGLFLVLNPENILLAAIIGGAGALIADMLIFSAVRFSFMDEFEMLKKTKTLRKLEFIIEKDIGLRIAHYLLYAVVGFIIASPLPDEIGISMLAGLTKIRPSILAVISFACKATGILVMLLIVRAF